MKQYPTDPSTVSGASKSVAQKLPGQLKFADLLMSRLKIVKGLVG